MSRVGRWRRRRRLIVLTTTLAAAGIPGAAAAQLTVRAGVGVRAASTLVHDSIVVPIDLRARPGPMVTLGASLPLDSAWTATVTLDLAWNALSRDAPNQPDANLGTVRAFAAALTLHRPLRAGVRGGIGLGVLGYDAGRDGVFSRGTPGLTALGMVLLRYEPQPERFRHLALEARYDIHRFITPALRDVGFTAARPVHRVAILLTAPLAGASR